MVPGMAAASRRARLCIAPPSWCPVRSPAGSSCPASDKTSEAAWKAGMEPLERIIPAGMKLLPPDECSLADLDKALDELAASANPVKKYILSAVIYTITADKQITIEEKELVRAVSEALDCPIPIGAMG
jgi:hypothetical protein